MILGCAEYSANGATPFAASSSKALALALASWLIAPEAEMTIATATKETSRHLAIFYLRRD
jgi:hypothetical protein